MLKKGVLFLLLAVLLSSSVFAADPFIVTAVPVQPSIQNQEQAEYSLTIENKQAADDTFRIKAPEVFWSVQSKPLHQYFSGVEIPALSSGTVNLLVNPIQAVPAGQYKVEVDVESLNTGLVSQVFLVVNVRSNNQPVREYLPSVARKVEMPAKLDPRQPVQVSIILENKNPRNIESLVITGSSRTFRTQTIASLEPLSKKTVKLDVSIDPQTQPQKDTAVWSFKAGEFELEPVKVTYEVVAYTQVSERQKEAGSGFLSFVDETEYVNNGNSVAYKTVERKSSILKRIFASAEPAPFYISKPEGSYLVWDLTLEPNQPVTLRYVENYRILGILALIGAVLTLLYYLFRSPVTIRKEAAIIGFEEGGISDIKVILHIKNRTSRPFERLTVVDKVPAIAHIAKEMEIGSLKPVKTVNSKDGMLIRWELENIEKREERVFSYTIKSKLSIIGRFTLPRCTAKFHEGNAEKRTTSNPVSVSI